MKSPLVLVLVALLSVAASLVAVRALPASAPGSRGGAAVDAGDSELATRLAGLERRLAGLEGRLAGGDGLVAPTSTSSGSPRVAVGEIERAVDAWLREHLAPDLVADAEPANEAAPAAGPRALEDVLAGLLAADSIWSNDDVWETLRKEDRIDEVLAALEGYAQEHADDPDAQVALAGGYLQAVFGSGNTPRAGQFASLADQAFDSALELDPGHWEARFSKAVSLSNWPAFLGKGDEAIRQFSVLIEKQELEPPRPRHAQAYLFLGNMYQQRGETVKALEAWKRGLVFHPDDSSLLEKLQPATGR